MIGFESAVMGHHQPLTFAAASDQWTALITPDQGHAQEVSATLLGDRRPEEGRVTVKGVDLYDVGDEGLSPLFEKIGVISKWGRFLSNLSVGENIALPYQYQTLTMPRQAHKEMRKMIETLGDAAAALSPKLNGRVDALEPEERRMAELIRALMVKPDYYLLLNVTDTMNAEESQAWLDLLKRNRRPGEGAFFLVAKGHPAFLEKMDASYTLV